MAGLTRPPEQRCIHTGNTHSMGGRGCRQASLSARPRRQWLATVLKVLPLLLLTAPPSSAWGCDWKQHQQDITPQARPLSIVKAPTSGNNPTCDQVGPEFVTLVHAVEGFDVTFHCPCTQPGSDCSHNTWPLPEPSDPTIMRNSTHLTILNVSRAHLGCVVCQRPEGGSYLLFNITEVKAPDCLHFESGNIQSTTSTPGQYKLHLTSPKFDNKSYNFSVDCPVFGYPPYQSISWDLSHWEQYQPCVSFSSDNRTVTFRIAKEFNTATIVTLHCTATNQFCTLVGVRDVDPNPSIQSQLDDFFAEPMQIQTAGRVELDESSNASFVCASKGYSNYQVCSVSYNTLTVVERCAAISLSTNATCCAVNQDGESSGNCSSLAAQKLSAEQDTVSMLNVTTSDPGYYQCQVYNSKVGGYQSIGEPILVGPPPEDDEADDTTPYLYLFIGSLVVIVVLLVILVGVALGVVYSMAKKKVWSSSGDEGRQLLRRQSTRSSMASNMCEPGRTAVIMDQRLHGEGSHYREVGQHPVFSDPPLLPLHEGRALNNEAVPLQTLDSFADFDEPTTSMNSQGSNVGFDDISALETVFEASTEPQTNSFVSATNTMCLEPAMLTPSKQANPSLPAVSLELLIESIPQMAPKWFVLAVGLGVSTEAAIIDDNNGRADKKCTEALGAWINAGRDVTWARLLHVLHTQNLGAVASSIESKLMSLISREAGPCYHNGSTA